MYIEVFKYVGFCIDVNMLHTKKIDASVLHASKLIFT
jgi:hypothetical protein